MTRTLAGGAGAAGFVAGHLVGDAGWDFCTGRTGNGWMFTAGAAGGVVVGGAVVDDVMVVDGPGVARCCVEWQPHITAPSKRTLVSLRVPIKPLQHRFIGETADPTRDVVIPLRTLRI